MSVIEVAISPGEAAGRFRVEVVSSPAGEASAVTGLDVGLLMTRRPELQQAVPTSAVATRKILPETERCVREVGHQLFAALLGAGEVAGRYRASAALAAGRGEPLRVVLRMGDPALAGLPWEATPVHWADNVSSPAGRPRPVAETGELTPTLKLKRRVVHAKYADIIDSLYAG